MSNSTKYSKLLRKMTFMKKGSKKVACHSNQSLGFWECNPADLENIVHSLPFYQSIVPQVISCFFFVQGLDKGHQWELLYWNLIDYGPCLHHLQVYSFNMQVSSVD